MHYKVVVVDDSPFMRKIISDLIERDSNFQVVGTAVNGWEAIMKVPELNPDIVTMDVEMPEMNGLEALQTIMKKHPLPVIMLSGINEEGMRETILALESGAFDFIRKPTASISNDINQVGDLLLEKMNVAMQAKERRTAWQAEELVRSKEKRKQAEIRAVNESSLNNKSSKPSIEPDVPLVGMPLKERINTFEGKGNSIEELSQQNIKRTSIPRKIDPKPKGMPRELEKKQHLSLDKKKNEDKPVISTRDTTPSVTVNLSNKSLNQLNKLDRSFEHLIAIGCSTGGPRALKELLEQIPEGIPAPILIVQHMPPNFTKSLAQRLNTFSSLEVVEAEHGMVLHRGYAYIAPGGFHMKIIRVSDGHYEISLTQEEPRNGHRPSVDTMFDSLLPLNLLDRHVVLLTGMGSDGSRAMKRLYDAGVTDTYAESEETCVVYGMPRSAVELKCVSHVLPLQSIPSKLVQMTK